MIVVVVAVAVTVASEIPSLIPPLLLITDLDDMNNDIRASIESVDEVMLSC